MCNSKKVFNKWNIWQKHPPPLPSDTKWAIHLWKLVKIAQLHWCVMVELPRGIPDPCAVPEQWWALCRMCPSAQSEFPPVQLWNALGRAGKSFPLYSHQPSAAAQPQSCPAAHLHECPAAEGRCLQHDFYLCWPWKHKLPCRTWRTGIKGWLQQGCVAKSNAALWSPISVYPNVWDEVERQWINRLELKARQAFFLFCIAFCTRIQLRRVAFLVVQQCRHMAKMDFCLCAACTNLRVVQVFMTL